MAPTTSYQQLILTTCILYLQVQQDSSGLDSEIRHVIHRLITYCWKYTDIFFYVATHQQFVHIILSHPLLMLLNS